MTGDLIPEDPPPPRGGPGEGVVRAWLDSLRTNPDVWHRYPDLQPTTGLASHIKSGRYRGIAPREFEAVTRTVTVDGEKRFQMYARYLGDPR